MDTIYALASARGKAGVSIVRVSGPDAYRACSALTDKLPQPRVPALRILRSDDDVLDHALVLCFESGHSFTGEQTVELHLHGSTAIVTAVMDVLGAQRGVRMAAPGEFTRRALENGRLDLAQVEGLADLIEAETEAQRKQAMRVFSGVLGEKAQAWRSMLVRAVALLEATIDFADEPVPVDVRPEVLDLLERLMAELRREKSGYVAAERVRDGFEVAIVGAPNVGKSTLLNRLAGRDAAITSAMAGTTRDVIEVRMDIAGLPVTLIDTAGIREAADGIEAIGIERALQRAAMADLRVFLVDEAGRPDQVEENEGDIVLRAKCDVQRPDVDGVSGRSGAGVPELLERIGMVLRGRVDSGASITRLRHKQAVGRAIEALEYASLAVKAGLESEEIIVERLRETMVVLDSIVGRLDVEVFLDEIFSSFCIGK